MAGERVQYPTDAFDRFAEVEDRHWWFVWRNRIILSALRRAKPEIERFLEVGCGTGFVLRAIREQWPEAYLETAELHLEGIEHARRRVPSAVFRQQDVRFMQAEAKFDAIGAFDVLEHIDEDRLVVRNLASALSPRGVLIVTVPQHPWMWSHTDERACHVRRYTRPGLQSVMADAGLEIVHSTSFVSLLLPLMWLARTQRAANADHRDAMAEFRISSALNAALSAVMAVERSALQLGFTFPAGGSLLMICKKPG
jgi:trans-aconitate methyltransferase